MIIQNSNLRRSFFSNRYKILVVIIAIILILCVIQILNEISKVQIEKDNNKIMQEPIQTTQTEAIISGEKISDKLQETNTNIIENFINFCNEKEIEKAYSLLTDECKEIFNSNIEIFKRSYVEEIFNEKRICSMQIWMTANYYTTYRISLTNDILSTGKKGQTLEEYYTIVLQNGEYKLNINKYIGRTQINRQNTIKDITISILSKDVYKDYEIYNINIQNDSEDTILLDSKKQPKSSYITSTSKGTYSALMYEIDDASLTVEAGKTKNISIRFNKMYNPSTYINSITFSDIITDLEKYKTIVNKEEYKETVSLKIEI